MDCHHWAQNWKKYVEVIAFLFRKTLSIHWLVQTQIPFEVQDNFSTWIIQTRDEKSKSQTFANFYFMVLSEQKPTSVLKILLTYLKNTYLLPWCPLWWFDDLIDVIVVLDDIKITCSDDFGSDQSSRDQFKNMIQYLNWYMTGDTFWVNTWDMIWALTRDLIQDIPTKKCTIWICKERMKIWADFRGF